MKQKPPTIQQLVDIVREYNVARAQEISQKPATGWPQDYKNPMMDALYDCAKNAAEKLKSLMSAIEKRVDLTINLDS